MIILACATQNGDMNFITHSITDVYKRWLEKVSKSGNKEKWSIYCSSWDGEGGYYKESRHRILMYKRIKDCDDVSVIQYV